jgi:hypothetical protein
MRVLVALAALSAVPLAGCAGPVSLGSGDDDSRRLEVRGTHTGFDVEVPEDWGITDVWDSDTCGSVSYRIREGHELRLAIEAVPASCAEAGGDPQIGNGFHGLYRTIEDVPEPEDVETVSTALGEAAVFTQEYFECTNSCDRWQEPVAIVSVDDPVDAGFPTLVLRGEQDSVSRAELEELLATLAPPYVPTG